MSQPVSSLKRSHNYEQQNEEDLNFLKLMVEEQRAQAKSTKDFQEKMLRELDQIKSDLKQISEVNQTVIDRNSHIIEFLDLLLLVIILDG